MNLKASSSDIHIVSMLSWDFFFLFEAVNQWLLAFILSRVRPHERGSSHQGPWTLFFFIQICVFLFIWFIYEKYSNLFFFLFQVFSLIQYGGNENFISHEYSRFWFVIRKNFSSDRVACPSDPPIPSLHFPVKYYGQLG